MKQIFMACLGVLLLLNSCTKQQSAGNTVETENCVSFQVVFQDGKPASMVQVKLRPAWYVADTLRSTDTSLEIRNLYTDKRGMILCKGLPQGRYVVQAMGDTIGAVTEVEHVDTARGNEFAQITLLPMGSLQGTISLPVGIPYAWVQFYGLDEQVKTDSLGDFNFKAMPPGTLRVRAIAYKLPTELAEDFVQIRSHSTVDAGTLAAPTIGTEDPATWRYSRTVRVDSLASNWMRPLSNPTVLTLHLDSSNFDFSQAISDGRDLRIFDAQGNPLAHQRARWDSVLRKAVIRVRIETVVDSTTRIELRWGRPGAVDPSYAKLWNGIKDSVKQELYTLLIDDFEHNSIQTALPPPIPANHWYWFASDSTVTITPDFATALQPAGAGRSGHALHFSYSDSLSQWNKLGTALGSGSRSLATLDSIVFWVRGTGIYSLTFDNLGTNGGKAWIHDSLDTIWTRKSIRPRDLMPEDSIAGNVGWNNVKDAVTNLTFFFGGGKDFWIDDIRMYGINRDNLMMQP